MRPKTIISGTKSRSRIPHHLETIEQLENLSLRELKQYQRNKVNILLQHAYNHVPYYHSIKNTNAVIPQ